jgi:plastocyanin
LLVEMTHMTRRLFACLCALLCVGLIGSAQAQGAARSTAPVAPTAVNPPGLPQTGSLFGAFIQIDCAWSGCDRKSAQTNVETQQALRTMALDRQYYLWDDTWPTTDDLWSAQGGRTLELSWNPNHEDGSVSLWADIASGVYDTDIHNQAAKIKAFPYPIFFTFHHEPQNAPPGGGSYGTPTDFQNAWRHIHDLFVADGVTNVRYLMILFASTYKNGKADLYYPGDQYVDILGADGYNWYQCGGPWESFAQVFGPYYNYGLLKKKPMIIAEYGTGEDPADPNRKAQWFTDALATAKTWPELKGVTYYDTGKNPLCLRWINTSPQSQASFAAIGADPWFNPAPDTTPPVTSLTAAPASQTISTTATFGWTATELGVRYTCSLDGGAFAACYDFARTYTSLALGTHSFSVKATDYSGNVGAAATWSWTIVSTTLPVTVRDSGFNPKTAASVQGRSVNWTVDASSTQTHRISDTSGMNLFLSPVLSANQSWAFTFVAAGNYPYNDKLHPTLTGTIKVPVTTFPLAGALTTTFTLTWASAAPPPNYVFDVQIKRPGGNWQTWRSAQTVTNLTFVPDSGTGTYGFRARLTNSSNGTSSNWSAEADITVS